MKRFLISTTILVIPSLALWLLFHFINIGNEDSRNVVSLSFGLVLSAYFLLSFPIGKHNGERTEEVEQ